MRPRYILPMVSLFQAIFMGMTHYEALYEIFKDCYHALVPIYDKVSKVGIRSNEFNRQGKKQMILNNRSPFCLRLKPQVI